MIFTSGASYRIRIFRNKPNWEHVAILVQNNKPPFSNYVCHMNLSNQLQKRELSVWTKWPFRSKWYAIFEWITQSERVKFIRKCFINYSKKILISIYQTNKLHVLTANWQYLQTVRLFVTMMTSSRIPFFS